MENVGAYVLQEEPWLGAEDKEHNAMSVASLDIAQDPMLQNNLQLKKRVADSIGNRTTVCRDGESILSKIQTSRGKKPRTLQSSSEQQPSNFSQGVMRNPRFSRNRLSFQPMVQGRPNNLQSTLRPPAEFYDLVSPPCCEHRHDIPPTRHNEEAQSMQTPVARRLPTVGPETTMQASKVRNHFLKKSIDGDPLTVEESRVYRAINNENDQLHGAIHETLRQMRGFDLQDAPERLAVTLVQIYGSNDA